MRSRYVYQVFFTGDEGETEIGLFGTLDRARAAAVRELVGAEREVSHGDVAHGDRCETWSLEHERDRNGNAPTEIWIYRRAVL